MVDGFKIIQKRRNHIFLNFTTSASKRHRVDTIFNQNLNFGFGNNLKKHAQKYSVNVVCKKIMY